MKIIEAMKKIKDLQIKADDLRGKVKANSALLNYETPLYQDTKEQVRQWIQAHSDILKEVLSLRVSIQKTNIQTDVTMELGGKSVTKTIAEWIHRRRDLAGLDMAMYRQLTDRGLKEGQIQESTGGVQSVKIVRFYDPEERDRGIELYRTEPSIIDSTLEVINATTDLVV
jgi:hypothetical protein